MNNIAGLILTGWGAWLAHYGLTTTNDVQLMLWIKSLGLVSIGLGIVGYNSFSYVKSLIQNYKTKKAIKKEEQMSEGKVDLTINPKKEELDDSLCLYYLTERVKGSPEGLELCAKLSALLFTLHHKEVVDAK